MNAILESLLSYEARISLAELQVRDISIQSLGLTYDQIGIAVIIDKIILYKKINSLVFFLPEEIVIIGIFALA